jgi:arsenate reductase
MRIPTFYKLLDHYCSTLEAEFDQIKEDRKEQLRELGAYIYKKIKAGKDLSITVICTHNSRRSHLGQIWLEAAVAYYNIGIIQTASGGTEATAFFPRAVEAIKKAGFKVVSDGSDDNPVYEVSLGEDFEPIKMFSKKYDHSINPRSEFAAIMVCSSADAACPIVPGADARFSIQFEDPKNFDGTPSEEMAYEERCRQIAREMFYAVKFAKDKLDLLQENTLKTN